MTEKVARALVLSLVLVLALAGCRAGDELSGDLVWERNFMTNGEEVRDNDWFFEGGYTGEYPLGFYMNQTSIAAPYLFTGDFVVEFEFYLKFFGDENDYIYRYALRLVDPNWATYSTRRFFDLTAYYTDFPARTGSNPTYYQLAQGNGSYTSTDYYVNVPGSRSGVNTCRMVREGDVITVYMNGTLVRSVTISSSNQPYVGYAPFIHGHNSTDPADSNFYLRKVTVWYKSGERVYHDWNP